MKYIIKLGKVGTFTLEKQIANKLKTNCGFWVTKIRRC